MQVDQNIFKAYDIRGSYPEKIAYKAAYKIGQAFANYSKAKTLIVGHDSRLSSPSLTEALISGITNQGVDVIDIGLCSTSCFYFTVGDSGMGGGIMTTASHSPKKINGFKLVFKGNTSLTKEQISDLKKIVLEDEISTASAKVKIIKQDPTDVYVQAVERSIKEKIKPLKVVMDPGNGTAGLYIEKVFAGTGLQIV